MKLSDWHWAPADPRLPKRLYYHHPGLDRPPPAELKPGEETVEYDGDETGRRLCAEDEANLVSSLCDDGRHMPVLDVDSMSSLRATVLLTESWRKILPNGPQLRLDLVKCIASTSTGHWHMFVDVPLHWEEYEGLLSGLARLGVIEEGYYRAALRRKATFVRKPGVRKANPTTGAWYEW